MISFPPHITLKLYPLDQTFFYLLTDACLRENSGLQITKQAVGFMSSTCTKACCFDVAKNRFTHTGSPQHLIDILKDGQEGGRLL
jgi:hypothetical protein